MCRGVVTTGTIELCRQRHVDCSGHGVGEMSCAARSFFLAVLAGVVMWAGEPVEAVAVHPEPSLRSEVLPLASGAELITFFEPLPDQHAGSDGVRELPLLAVLKDTLDDSDPGNDQIRQVWVLTYSQPSLWRRLAGGVPFLYHRAGLDRGPGTGPPRAVMDLGDPSRGAWGGVAMAAVQSEVVDPIGAVARLTTHSFFGNYGEYRNTHIWEASDVLSASLPANPGSLTADEIHSVEERLELAGHPLGGFVGDDFLQHDEAKQRAKRTEERGHNWELLRQRAEDSGLYIEPLDSSGLSASFTILWSARGQL